jgi:hypothetical protein
MSKIMLGSKDNFEIILILCLTEEMERYGDAQN